ncbi:MAG: ribonuclease HI [Deltaproteobacteria bacterium]|jgi:ribonuclease HI|nr:ribonuclease HI [Deltaproteobacteria bacterium]
MKSIIIYTDGACSGNPGPAGAGVFLSFGDYKKYIYQYLGEATNNIAELKAIEIAVDSLKTGKYPVTIHTDSSYSLGVLSKNWKTKKNKELISTIKVKLQKYPKLQIKKVTGHAGVEGNEIADELARLAVETKTSHTTTTSPL